MRAQSLNKILVVAKVHCVTSCQKENRVQFDLVSQCPQGSVYDQESDIDHYQGTIFYQRSDNDHYQGTVHDQGSDSDHSQSTVYDQGLDSDHYQGTVHI
jgi:hypothetical protein